MSETEKLIFLRTMVGNESDNTEWGDDVLLTYLAIAGQKIINRAYPYDDEVTEVPRR